MRKTFKFNVHKNLEGLHAPFSASQSSWLRYDEEKMRQVYKKKKAAALGTRYHAYAAEAIALRLKQANNGTTISMYINDAIGYRMTPEVILMYSNNFFGTADSISFRNNILRIHDLKTGEGKVHMDQLLIYAALFCLEYGIVPGEIVVKLRIYQNDSIERYDPTTEEIVETMDKIVSFNKILESEEF